MLKVRTYLDKSEIHGIGVFADEFIPKNTLVWELHVLDMMISYEYYDTLPDAAKEFIKINLFNY